MTATRFVDTNILLYAAPSSLARGYPALPLRGELQGVGEYPITRGMARTPRRMSEILKEMSQQLLRDPRAIPSSEAAHVSLFIAHMAWNESVGLGHSRENCRESLQPLEQSNPELWAEFHSPDVSGMIDQLVQYKNNKFAKDRRRVLSCEILEGRMRVESLPPAAPDVDSRSEMKLYGLVRTGRMQEAQRFVERTLRMTPALAEFKVAEVAMRLGLTR